MSGFPINFDAASFEKELASKPEEVAVQPAPLTLPGPKLDPVPKVTEEEADSLSRRFFLALPPGSPAPRGEAYLVGRGISPDDPISEELLDILVPKDDPKLPFVPNNADEERIIRLARRNMAAAMILREWELAKVKKPSAAAKPTPRASAAPALPPASQEDLLGAALRAVTAAVKAGSATNCTVPDSWFAGMRVTIAVDSVEDKADKEHIAAKLRSLGAKVSFQIGTTPEKVGKGSYKTTGRVSQRVISQLKGPMIKILQSGPKTTKQIEEALAPDNYDCATYFNINQILHALGCIKTEGQREPADRGPRYLWSLPTQEAAG